MKKNYSESIISYIRKLQNYPVLKQNDIIELCRKAKKGDKKAKRHLIESNLKIVLPLARKYYRPGVDIFDLIEEGNLGLIRSIEKYDPRKKVRLSTYATYWIEQYIKRSIEEQSKTIRIPPHIWESLRKWLKKWEELHGELGRNPTLTEMTLKMHLSVKQIKNIIDAIELYQGMGSLEAPIDEQGELYVKDVVTDKTTRTPEAIISTLKLHDELDAALDKIGKRERKIIELRFGLNENSRHTLKEIGLKLHLSRERVRQLEKRVLERLHWITHKMKLI
jgi:RNA polymerase sigma factor (sigma-70 family)